MRMPWIKRGVFPLDVYDNTILEMVTTCGPASGTFDPSFITSKTTQMEMVILDESISYTTAAGTSHSFSHTFANNGTHRVLIRCKSVLDQITSMDSNTDLVTSIKDVDKLHNCTSLTVHTNTGLSLNLSKVPRNLTTLNASTAGLYGDLCQLPNNLTTAYLSQCTSISGAISSLPSSLQYCTLFSDTLLTAASIAHLTAIRDIRLYSIGWLTASVDIVITSVWGARASYSYSTPSLQIGGTNQTPSGTYAAPSEGENWHEDTPGHWVPLTGKAMIYDLVNDVNSEGFHAWTITYTA